MLWLALVLALLGGVLWVLSSRQRRATGLPGGQVIYADTNAWETVKQPLFDAALGLTGKPDYLVKQGELLIPVEVKSKRIGNAPYDSHVYQLAAYCLLVQRVFGKRPQQGILHYPNRTFSIDFTPELESAVINIILEMQSRSGRNGPERSHDVPARCARCGFRAVCDQSLH